MSMPYDAANSKTGDMPNSPYLTTPPPKHRDDAENIKMKRKEQATSEKAKRGNTDRKTMHNTRNTQNDTSLYNVFELHCDSKEHV